MQLFAEVVAPDLAPGCYAAASVFNHDSEVCRQCGVLAECGAASMQTLQAIQASVDVRDLLRRHQAVRKLPAPSPTIAAMAAQEDDEAVAAVPELPTLPPERAPKAERVVAPARAEDLAVLELLPKKAAEHAVRFIKTGLLDAMRTELLAGANPFATAKPEFMRVVCDALLTGGTTRSALKQRFVDELGWGDSAAASHVSQAFPLMTRFHIAVENDGRLELIPARD